MVIIEIYEKPIKVTYKSTLISKASFAVLVCSLLSVIVPFILAYKSEGFWLKHDTFYEQPRVKFKGHYLLIATTDNLSKSIICSTFRYYQEFLNTFDECMVIKAREEDSNYDGILDKIFFTFQLNLGKDVKLSSINIVLPVNYELRSTCALEMESAILYQQIQPRITSELSVYADLQLFQSESIWCSRYHTNLAYNKSVIPTSSNKHPEEYYLENILMNYAERRVKTTLSNVFTTFKSSRKGTFTINLTVRYPEHLVRYKPNTLQVLKMAWIQYLSIYILVAWVMFQVKDFIFRRNYVVFYKVNPLKTSK